MDFAEVRRKLAAPKVKTPRQNGGCEWQHRPVAPAATQSQLHGRGKKQKQGYYLRRENTQAQLRALLQDQPELEDRGNRQANPAHQPQTKISVRMVSPKQ